MLLLVFVQEPYPYIGVGAASSKGLNEHLALGQAAAAAAFGRVRELAEGKGVQVESATLEEASPAEQIVEAANRAGADQIVMASHGRSGLARMFVGSVAKEVLERSPVPVLIVKCTWGRLGPTW